MSDTPIGTYWRQLRDDLLDALNLNPERTEARALAKLVSLDKSENHILAILGPDDTPAFLDACSELAMLGYSPDQLEQIVHATCNNRILGFSSGYIHDIGEFNGVSGRTRGSRPYLKEDPQ